jgi:D-alanyl-D-alanine carboxypeptidase (penicillin-binding protein 5/6)
VAVLAALLALVAAGSAAAAPPAVSASSYILVNPATGEVLAQRSPDRRLPMASTTKIMTALLTLERARLDDTATVPAEAAVANLVTGEQVRVRDLLVGLLVPSGNDAAITLAVKVGGSQSRFVAMMNRRARQLGLRNTHFLTPHGLDVPGHYSSVRDLVTLARVAMRRPELRRIVAMKTASVPGAFGSGRRFYEAQNDLLRADPEVDGVKTGHTDGAGYALVAHAKRARLGVDLFAALIGSTSEGQRVTDGRRLLDYGFRQYARPTLIASGQVFGRARVYQRPGVRVAYQASGPLVAPIRLDRPIVERVVAPPELRAPIRAGQVVGRVEVREGARLIGRRDLVAAEDVAAPSALDRLRSAWGNLFS